MLPGVAQSAFESASFGGAVWRYAHDGGATPSAVAVAARFEDVRLVMCRIPADARAAAAALESAGFRLIERLVTLGRAITPVPEVPGMVVPASPEDRDACADIAVAALRQDRFHADPRIDNRIADAIKVNWVSNNLAGRADLSLVARDARGRTVGFNQLLRVGPAAVIDLIAVAPDAQRQGHGKALVAAGLAAYASVADTMRVGTQASNRSLALYRSLGFEVLQEQSTYHLAPELPRPHGAATGLAAKRQ